MATYKQLKEFAKDMSALDTSVYMNYDISNIGNKIHGRVSRANDAFCEANRGVTGVIDVTIGDHYEPEDVRGAFANNQALCRLPEALPLLEEMNKYLKPEQLESESYSMCTLWACAEILNAKDAGLGKDEIDYLCKTAATMDYGFGDYRSSVAESRNRLYQGETLDHVKFIGEMKDSNMQSVDFYREFCSENNLPANDDAIRVIGTAPDMGIAYGLQDAMKYKNLSVKDAKMISDCVTKIQDAITDKNLNTEYTHYYEWDNDGKNEVSESSSKRFFGFNMDAYVEDMMEMKDFEGNYDKFPKLIDDFIKCQETYEETLEKSGKKYEKPYTCISHYYEQHKDLYKDLLANPEKKDYECKSIQNAFDDPYVVETISIIDNKPFAYESSDRIGHVFNIDLSDKLADKLGIYHDDEFCGRIQYATFLDGSHPEINACVGLKSVAEKDYWYDDKGELQETIKGTHLENVYESLNESEGRFTKSQVEQMCDIVRDVVKENYPDFELSKSVTKSVEYAPEKPSLDKTKAVSAEFSSITTESTVFDTQKDD